MPNTSGGEYVCQAGFDNFPGCGDGPNGTYIGFYHTHPNKGPMAGAQHSTQPHPLLMNVGSYQKGGLLRGPSHEQGGIPARVGGSTGELVELEGDEYIINAQSAKALGTQFLDKINSTATTHHQGGFPPGRLPSPSQYKRGGKVMRKRMKRGGRARKRFQTGGHTHDIQAHSHKLFVDRHGRLGPQMASAQNETIPDNWDDSTFGYEINTGISRPAGGPPWGVAQINPNPLYYGPEYDYLSGAYPGDAVDQGPHAHRTPRGQMRRRGGRAANKYYDPYKFAGGGRPERKAPECGGQCLTIRDCNPGCRCMGSTAGTYGTCVPRAAQFRRRQPMARGGRVRNRRMQYGGSPTPMRTTGTRRVGRIGSSGNNVLGHFNGGKRQKGPGQF